MTNPGAELKPTPLQFGACLLWLVFSPFPIGVLQQGLATFQNAVPEPGGVWSFLPFLVFLTGASWLLNVNPRSQRDLQRLLFCVFSVVAVVAAFLGMQVFLLDFTYDGQGYQQQGAAQLARGWNIIKDLPTSEFWAWHLVHFPKLTWFFSSWLLTLGTSLDAAKIANSLAFIASLCLAFSALITSGFTRGRALALAFLLAGNPIGWNLLPTFGVDGLVGALILSVLSTGYLLIRGEKGRALHLGFFIGSVMLLNAKTTGVVHLTFLFVGLVGSALLLRMWRLAKIFVAYAALICIFGGAVLGYSPFVTGYFAEHTPVAPLRVIYENKVPNQMQQFRPPALKEASRFERWFYSAFGTSTQFKEETTPLKLPFTATQDEFLAAATDMCRIGGMGPLFGGSLILALALLIALTLEHKFRLEIVSSLAMVLLLLASCLVNPEPWWHRFIPQLWLLPFFPLWIVARKPAHHEKNTLFLAALLTLCLTINSVGVAVAVGSKQVQNQARFAAQIERLKHSDSLYAIKPPWASITYRLNLHGIHLNYRPDALDLKFCQEQIEFGSTDYRICLKSAPL